MQNGSQNIKHCQPWKPAVVTFSQTLDLLSEDDLKKLRDAIGVVTKLAAQSAAFGDTGKTAVGEISKTARTDPI